MRDAVVTEPNPIVASQGAESYTILPGAVSAGIIFICDHAGNAFPEGYDTLGLGPADLKRHIAYDIGAAEVTRLMSAALRAPAIMSHYSRLLIDVNRGLDDPTLIMRLSDGTVVPDNGNIDPVEREKRIRLYYEPYHRAIDRLINESLAAGIAPMLLSIHSFTESLKGAARPWHAAVLWGDDPRLATALIEALRADINLVIGDNEPYLGGLEGDTLWRHGKRRGLAHAIVEVRQDLVRDATGQAAWAKRLIQIVGEILARPDLGDAPDVVLHNGSRMDGGARPSCQAVVISRSPR